MLGAIFKITKLVHVAVALLFLGVPTKVSFSRFLSLIRLRLLSDPEHTDSPPNFTKHHMPIFFLSFSQMGVFPTTSSFFRVRVNPFFYNMATQLRTEARQNVHWYSLSKHTHTHTTKLKHADYQTGFGWCIRSPPSASSSNVLSII